MLPKSGGFMSVSPLEKRSSDVELSSTNSQYRPSEPAGRQSGASKLLQSPHAKSSQTLTDQGNDPRLPKTNSVTASQQKSFASVGPYRPTFIHSRSEYQQQPSTAGPRRRFRLSSWLYWNVSQGDYEYLKTSIRLFPLKFNDTALESEYRIAQQPLYQTRCTLIAALGACSFIFSIAANAVIVINDFVPSIHPILWWMVGSTTGALICFIFVALSPFLPYLKDHLEACTVGGMIGVIDQLHALNTQIFTVSTTYSPLDSRGRLSQAHSPFTSKKINRTQHSLVAFTNAYVPFVTVFPFTNLLCQVVFSATILSNRMMFTATGSTDIVGAKLFADVCDSCLWLWSMLLLDAILPTRSRFTLIPHLLILIFFSCPRIVQFIKLEHAVVEAGEEHHLVFVRVLTGLQIYAAATLIGLSYIGRYYMELQGRADYLRLKTSLQRVTEIQEKKQKKRKGGATMVESVLSVLEKAQYFVRCLTLETGNVNLKATDELLLQCLITLGNTDELFAVRFDMNDDVVDSATGQVQAQFYNLYANKIARTPHGKPLGSILGSRTFSNRSASRPGMAQSSVVKTASDLRATGPVPIPKASLRWTLSQFISESSSKKLKEQVGVSPSLDLLKLHETNENILCDTGCALLDGHVEYIGASPQDVVDFLKEIEKRYFTNPYHNSCHGAVVAHVSNCFARALGLFRRALDVPWSGAVFSISALCHDVGHPGRNNAFFCNTKDQLALLYNDVAVLENYHCFITFALFNTKFTTFFSQYPRDEVRLIRKRIIEMILATDMGQHFEFVSRFRLRKQSPEFDIDSAEDMWLVARICIKAADLSHALVDWKQHVQWSLRVAEEFYQQGDEEAKIGVPVSPLCDRATHKDFAKSQKGFLEFVVQPLILELEDVDDSDMIGTEWTRALVYNKFRWEELAKGENPPEIPAEIHDMETDSGRAFLGVREAVLKLAVKIKAFGVPERLLKSLPTKERQWYLDRSGSNTARNS